jgi:hypothetical protein
MTIALVSGQVIVGSGATVSSVVVNLPVNPTQHNLVVVLFCFAAGSATTPVVTVQDSNLNNYTLTSSSPFANAHTTNGWSGIAYLRNAPSIATRTITVSYTGPTAAVAFDVWALELSGADIAIPFEGEATASQGVAGTAINTPSYTTKTFGDLLVAITQPQHTVTSCNAPWTGISSTVNGIGISVNGNAAEYLITTSTVTQAVSFTQASGTWDAQSAAFIQARPVQRTWTDLPPALSVARFGRERTLDTWAFGTPLTLRAAPVVMPPVLMSSRRSYDLPRGYPRPDVTWTQSTNFNLIGQGSLAIRHIYSIPRTYPRIDATWTWPGSMYLPVTVTPPFAASYDLPRTPPRPDFTYTWQGNALLPFTAVPSITISQVTDPPPRDARARRDDPNAQTNLLTLLNPSLLFLVEQWYDLTPRGFEIRRRDDPNAQTNLLPLLNPALTLQVAQSYDLTPRPAEPSPRRSWEWSNVEYIGRGALLPNLPPASYELPRDPRAARTDPNAQTNLLTLLSPPVVQLPFNQYDWPLPRAADNKRRDDPNAQTNILLLNSSLLAAISQVYDLPPRDVRARRDDPNAQTSLPLFATLPFNQYDWPLPRDPRAARTDPNAQNANIPALLSTIVPFNQYDWPLPRDPRAARTDPIGQFNLCLATIPPAPLLPICRSSANSELTSRGYPYPNDLRTAVSIATPYLPPPPPPVLTPFVFPTPFGSFHDFGKAGSS